MAGLINFLANVYILFIIVRAVLSWVQHSPSQPVIKFIYEVTEPPLRFIRQYVPNFGGLDISPVILIFAVYLIEKILIRIF
jgi:YggT family protein